MAEFKNPIMTKKLACGCLILTGLTSIHHTPCDDHRNLYHLMDWEHTIDCCDKLIGD